MQKLQIPKNRMNYLIKQVQDHYDIVALEGGWEHYHKGKVMEIRLVEMAVLAHIKGGGSFEIMLDLETFSRSSCSCEEGDFCIHVASVFFHLYAPFGRPELLLQQLKQVIFVRDKTLRRNSKSAVAKAAYPLGVEPHMLPVDWHRFFEAKFYGFTISHQHTIEMFYQSVLETLPEYAASWPTRLRMIYELHTTLFALRKIEQFYIETKNSYLSYYHENATKISVIACIDTVTTWVQQCDPATFSEQSSHWQATIELIGEICLLGKVSPVDWLSIYRSIWWCMKDQPSWIDIESARLDTLINKKEVAPRISDIRLMARAHFDILLEQRELAFQRLSKLHALHAPDFYFYLQTYQQLKRWQDLLFWLRWIFPIMTKTNHDDFRAYCQYWLDVTPHMNSDQEWVEVMNALLPRSYYYYTSYLLKTKRYPQWVDLQLSNRISPLNLYTVELQAIEEHDCSLLLPLFHQATERAILEKNRNSYKIATRMLKTLQEYYIKLRQEDSWEQYIYRLADKFSRLRAFQEELKKGNWIR